MHSCCSGWLFDTSLLSFFIVVLGFLHLSFIDSYVYQIPGWSGLSNARVTIFGDVYPLPEDQQVID